MRRIWKFSILLLAAIPLLACSISVNLTPTPTAEVQPVATMEEVPVETVVPTEAPAVPTTESVPSETITVYFTDQAKFAVGTLPFEVAVTRPLPEGVDPIQAVLDAYFAGPTAEEQAQGLILVSSGFTGVREFTLDNGIAHIHFEGTCANNGAAYSVASVIGKNLEQFPEITAIKFFDEFDQTLDPDSDMSSLPYCLEP